MKRFTPLTFVLELFGRVRVFPREQPSEGLWSGGPGIHLHYSRGPGSLRGLLCGGSSERWVEAAPS